MGKLVVLKLDGDFDRGFRVKLEIGEEGLAASMGVRGELPPAPELAAQHESWQLTYRRLGNPVRIKAKPGQITNVSSLELKENCHRLSQQLVYNLNTWLRAESFLRIRESLLKQLTSSEEVRIIIQTEDYRLRRLPWHLWDLFEHNSKTEIALSSYDWVKQQSKPLKGRVRILAILGCSDGIDVQADQKLLENLPQAKTALLVEPTRRELDKQLWDEQGWDILFFAGHSCSEPGDEAGKIHINPTESLTIDELKYALKAATKHSLKLAIFNSCDGLGLAQTLAQFHIPQLIVMREPVPDPVAEAFLKYFLETFAAGECFYLAVRKAREKLQGMEGDFPCATWLPVICQNPVEQTLKWPKSHNLLLKFGRFLGLATAGIVVVAITSLTLKSLPQLSRFSLGERILITHGTTPQKLAGVKAFATSDFAMAQEKLQSSLQVNPNDPEALIYLNNAKAAGTKNPIRIAVSVPIGGNLNIAKEILRGVAQVQDEVNAGTGINGALLQVAIANDDNKPEIARKIATEFVNNQQILAVVGHNASEVSIAAAPIYQEGGLVMISPTSGALETAYTSSYIFRTVTSSRRDAKNLSHYAIQTAHKNKFIICSDLKSPYSESIKIEFRNTVLEEGGQVSPILCDFSNPNFNPNILISSAIADGADALLLTPSVERINQAIDLAKANKGQLTLFGSSTMYSFDTLKLGQVDVNGMVLAVVWHPGSAQKNPFLEKAKTLWGAPVNWRSAMAYDTTQAIVAGLKQSSTRHGLQKVLSGAGFAAEGATGKVQFLPSGDRKRIPGIGILVQVQPVAGSSAGYDFVPLKP
ncbi:MAG: ABC transporter substrate-binding protein [Microcoleus vaginatus WJT46-NPBG5]|jgi:branched-chain amino acid transport system substrate-binding protein|nr:ABC transporter substrate-binding protein [Microcoleus vaginatus WJT46-NPBG5]